MKRTLIILSVLLSLALTFCGGGGASTTINVTMTDFQFQPNQFTILAGQEITLDSMNNGAAVHNGEYQVVCRTEGHIASGMTAKLTVVASE